MSILNHDLQANYIIMNLLEKSKSKNDFVLENLRGIYAIISEDGTVYKGNQELALLLGIPSFMLRSVSLKQLFNKESWNIFQSKIASVNGKPFKSLSFELQTDAIGIDDQKHIHWEVYEYGFYRNQTKRFFFVLGTDLTQLRSVENQQIELFANIPIGILMVNMLGQIEPRYSAYLDWILGTSDLGGQGLNKVLFEPCLPFLIEQEKRAIEILFSTLGESVSYFENQKKSFPKRLKFPSLTQDDPLTLDIAYYPVVKNDQVYQLLLVVEDKSELIKIQNEGKKERGLELKTAKRIESLRRCPQDILSLAMREIGGVYERLRFLLEHGGCELQEVVQCLHGLKGSSRIAQFSELSDLCHETESVLLRSGLEHHEVHQNLLLIEEEWQSLQKLFLSLFDRSEKNKDSKYKETLSLIGSQLHLLYNGSKSINLLNSEDSRLRIEQIQFQINSVDWEELRFLEPLLKEVVRKTSEDLNKKVDFKFNCVNVRLAQKDRSLVYEILLHLINNAIAHGIESTSDRLAQGKNQIGIVELSLHQDLYSISGTLRDDGRGFDLEKLRLKLVQKGIVSDSNVMKLADKELIQYIFHSGFSTTEVLNQVSGRGVGLSAIVENLKKLNGTIKASVDTETKGARFEFFLKLKMPN